jgi:hypothetical protein
MKPSIAYPGKACTISVRHEPLTIMTYRIIGSDLADAVAKRISPTSFAQELSYFPSAITEQIYKEKGGHSMCIP